LVERYGSKLPLIAGPSISAAGFALLAMARTAGNYWTDFFPGVVVLALGMATSVAPLTTTVMNSVPARYAGVASGINNAVSRTAGLLAVAVLSIFMLFSFTRSLERRLELISIGPELREQIRQQRVRLAGAAIPEGLSPTDRRAIRSSLDESFVSGWRLVMFIAAGLAAGSAVSAWLLIEGRVQPAAHTRAKELLSRTGS